jgi:hypothetical protein
MRSLSFVNEDDEYYPNEILSETSLIVGFSVLAACFCWTAFLSIRVTSSCREFYEWNAIRMILPGIQWALALECVTLAIDSRQDIIIPGLWAIATYMLQATVAPGIFLSTFVMTFLAYRTRSIPFCMVYRGPGRSARSATMGANGPGAMDDDEEAMQPLVRPATMTVIVRFFSLGIFVLSLVVNFDVVWNQQDLAGRTGWLTVLESEWTGSTAHVYLSLLPMALTSLSCCYFSLLLWRYGTFFSMVIYPSIINPWVSPIIGTAFLIVGQCFGPDLFPLLSNAGILLYMMCFLRCMYEVRFDMKQAGDLGLFLTALGDDQVTGSVPVAATNGDSSFNFGNKPIASDVEYADAEEVLPVPAMQ